MKELTNEELINVNGGAVKSSVIAIIGAGIVFIVGFINGLRRPYSCSSSK